MSGNDSQQDTARKNALTGLAVVAVVLGMAGLSFASVPLYRLFCQVTGYGGTTQTAEALPDTILERRVSIHLSADVSRNMPWDFEAETRSVELKLGERGLVAFKAVNKTDKPVAGTAVYNVTPLKAGKYFHKIQCFCFDEQLLQPGQEVSMPVLFFVDPEMDADPDMEDVKVITLSYTFFPASSKELEEALEEFYNDADPADKSGS